MTFISPSELPDYRPAFTQGAARADLDGNLWIRTTAVRTGAGSTDRLYDVVERKGELADRHADPGGAADHRPLRRGGVVYMSARDEKGGWIERTKRNEGVRP